MSSGLRQAVAPLYLLACLILGGSAQGIWSNAVLQLAGLAIIAWAAAAPPVDTLPRRSRVLMLLFLAAVAWVLLQMVPLPASVWPSLGGRAPFAEGYRLLGLEIPARSLSLDPPGGLSTLLPVIPAAAMFCAIAILGAYRRSWLVAVLLVGAVAGILLGALQIASPDPRSSAWYLYPQSSFGSAAGFFANSNNMAMLLVVCMPFLAALVVAIRRRSERGYSTALVMGSAVALMLLVGVALSRSLAGYGLAIPVLIASALIVKRSRSKASSPALIVAAVGLFAVVAGLAATPIGERALGTSSSIQSRTEIQSTTVKAIADFMPLGTGLGTFQRVYQLYEDPDRLIRTRINHAHNDYLELILELGLPGALLLAAFLWWWGVLSLRTWRVAKSSSYAKAASVASAALLAHSLVEFPLRTAALSAVFAMCLALMTSLRRAEAEKEELRPTRHLVLK